MIANPWTPYGLGDDPFFQEPLAPTEDPARPVSLFVGRVAELQLLGGQIVGSRSSRAVVQGPAGVGKTSFVNRLKAAVAAHGVLTHAEPVRVQPGMSPRQFCGEVLRVLLQIRATVGAAVAGTAPEAVGKGEAGQGGRRPRARGAVRAVGDAVGSLVAGIAGDVGADLGGDDEAAFWRRIGRIVEGEDSVAAGIGVAGLSAQRERVRIPGEVGDLSLFAEVERALALLAGGEDRRARGAGARPAPRRVLVHVNNLENLSVEDARAAAVLMQSVRDVFLAPHGHWLFVGAGDVERNVFRAAAQVSGIVPVAVTLEPLAPEEVAELLARRYAHLQRGRRLVPPISPEVAAGLYARYHGDLRNFLRLLSRAVQQQAVHAPGVPLDEAGVVRMMAPVYWREAVAALGAGDAEHLAAAYRGQSVGAELRVADVAGRAGVTQAAASRLVQRLAASGALAHARTAGKSVYYRLGAGDLSVALGLVPR